MAVIQNPVKVCDQVFDLIENLTHQIRERMQDPKSLGGFEHYCLLFRVLGVDGFSGHCVPSPTCLRQVILISLALLQMCQGLRLKPLVLSDCLSAFQTYSSTTARH